ncbi:MAG: peptidylprolyl isomerase [Desulfosudaceae bacterium]
MPAPWRGGLDLDGNHSVFGRVIDSQKVVDAIRQGDTMERVTVSEV